MNDIIFTRNCGVELKKVLKETESADIFLLVDINTLNYCVEHLSIGFIPLNNRIIIPDGEHNKSLENTVQIWQTLSERGARRNSILINLGGGVVTDLGGFAASCFKRGISFINIPTTLLSQIDASVGGKNGINFDGLKNEIGIFSLPQYVFIDNWFLKTLPQRQILSGFAEMLKHALLADEEHLAEIMYCDLSDIGSEEFLELIKKSVDIKNAIVSNDLYDRGMRRVLNFGHTVGHAIESAAIRKNLEIYHGEAVAYGMIAELFLSVKKFGFDEKRYEAIRNFIREKFPRYSPVTNAEELYELMLHDKKNERDGVNFTLLRHPGEFEINQYCHREEILEALTQI